MNVVSLSVAKDLNCNSGKTNAARDLTNRGPHENTMLYQLGWTTLPGLRGLSVSEFRATPTNAPDNEKGIAVELANDAERDAFLRQLEQDFAPRRFTNAADAFDTVKAYILDRVAGKQT